MTKILLSGCCGKMGRTVTETALLRNDVKIVAGIDKIDDNASKFPVFHSFENVNVKTDVLIDFSNASNIEFILEYALKQKEPAVIATTGYSDSQFKMIYKASKEIPILLSSNFSCGMNVFEELTKTAAKYLTDYDIDIIEKHNRAKKDCPSGTALELIDNIKTERCDAFFDSSNTRRNNKNEIHIHSLRCGETIGEHTVIFTGENEVITINHTVNSRKAFSDGALKAALFLKEQSPGLYKTEDILK